MSVEMEYGISRHTLAPYLREVNPKILGLKKRGRKSNVPQEAANLIVDVAVKSDGDNKGKTSKELRDKLGRLCPDLTQEQISNTWRKTIHPRAKKEKLLTGNIVANATTSKRSAITVEQQFRFHTLVNDVDTWIRGQNIADGTGTLFTDVQDHFQMNMDETNCVASDGVMKIVGSHDRTKHDKETADSRLSITALAIGAASGDGGPVVVLTKGKSVPAPFDSLKYLEEDVGLPAGSQVIPTPTAYMTDDAFDALMPEWCRGIRQMPVVREHPDWWIRLTGDGFGSHKNTLKAQETLRENKIVYVIEEGDSSHVNQPFDGETAVETKRVMRSTLDEVRATNVFGAILGQTDLLWITLYVVKRISKKSWKSSFEKCNLNGKTRVNFVRWCKRIARHLEGGDAFLAEPEIDRKQLLPVWWKDKTSSDQEAILSEIDRVTSDGRRWNLTSGEIIGLLGAAKVELNDIQNLRVCYIVHRTPAAGGAAPPLELVAEVNKERLNRQTDLAAFTRTPRSMKGDNKALFGHQCQFRNRWTPTDGSGTIKPSDFLDVEYTQEQLNIIKPTDQDLTAGEILRSAGKAGKYRKLPQRRLNTLGEINNQCVVANDPKRIEKMKSKFDFGVALDVYKASLRKVKETKKAEKEGEMENVAKATGAKIHAAKLQGNPEPKITVDQMIAIALIMFHKTIEKKKRALVEEEFNKIRATRCDAAWIVGGEAFISAAAAKKKPTTALAGPAPIGYVTETGTLVYDPNLPAPMPPLLASGGPSLKHLNLKPTVAAAGQAVTTPQPFTNPAQAP
jgi:hypothetical protein